MASPGASVLPRSLVPRTELSFSTVWPSNAIQSTVWYLLYHQTSVELQSRAPLPFYDLRWSVWPQENWRQHQIYLNEIMWLRKWKTKYILFKCFTILTSLNREGLNRFEFSRIVSFVCQVRTHIYIIFHILFLTLSSPSVKFWLNVFAARTRSECPVVIH